MEVLHMESHTPGPPGLTCIPLAGNCFLSEEGADEKGLITEKGLLSWSDVDSTWSIFFKPEQKEKFYASLRICVPDGKSSILVSIRDKHRTLNHMQYKEFTVVPVGRYSTTGNEYLEMKIKGLGKSGKTVGNISHLILENIKGKVQFVVDPTNFYFGRRGPSVHLHYINPAPHLAFEYFYNEMTVPYGQDKIGSHYMVNGFEEGCFGVQVNSAADRRILFSVGSDFQTDDPSQVPEKYKVKVIRKDPDVIVKEFGNEGTGLQSYLKFNWKSETVYRFLLKGCPSGESSVFTAWFSSTSNPEWRLLASFERPKTDNHLTSIYSSSENFVPENGHMDHTVYFRNQWARTPVGGEWYEVTQAIYTGDATSINDRGDFAGGARSDYFFLRNCGFFCGSIPTEEEVTRLPSGLRPPQIPFQDLP